MINGSILARLKAGDPSAVDDAIMSCVKEAEKIARSISRNHPKKYDDIHSVALLGLCQAVSNIKNGKLETDNITMYIKNTIRGHIRHFIQNDHTIRITNYTLAQEMQSKDGFTFPIKYTIDPRWDDDNAEYSEHDDSFDIPAPDKGDCTFINEFYMLLTNFERIVLDLRSEGYTYQEIATRVNKSKSWIEKTLQVIKDKFITERVKYGR
jgi:RNA polymerase sigma factor (sigma-70 family)